MKKLMIFTFAAVLCDLTASIINIPYDYSTIQEGIDIATNVDTVLIHPGIYFESIDLHSCSTIASLFLTTQDTSFISQTILDANGSSYGIYSSEDYAVFKIIGFTIQNASYSGICFDLENILVCENMIITNNYTGIRAIHATLFLHNSIISNNSANGVSAGPFHNGYLRNVLIYDNGNIGLRIAECHYYIYNTTFINNPYGISVHAGYFDLVNSILWGSTNHEISIWEGYPVSCMYSNIQGGEASIYNPYGGTVNWLEGNINEDPLFIGYGDSPYSLSDNSPCVNTGIPDATGLNLPEFDLAGNLRIFGNRIDMGAFENQNAVLDIDFSTIHLLENSFTNHPNPFNPSTEITFQTSGFSNIESVEISIYNLKGQKVKTFLINALTDLPINSVIWNGVDEFGNPVSSGIYYYKLNVNGKTEAVKKCLLLK